jgi:HK97 family phage prohead protease
MHRYPGCRSNIIMNQHYRMFTLVAVYRNTETPDAPMRIIASDESVDRMGDIVEQTWRLDNFNRNPVLLWSHDPSTPPVGRAEDVRVEEIDGRPALTFSPKWDEGAHNPLANTVAEQFRNGTLNAVSVGFRPGAVTPRNALDESDSRFANTGLILAQNELLEISPVTIPANANALAIRAVQAARTDEEAEAIIARAVEQAEAVTKAALAGVPDLVAAEVLRAVSGKSVRDLVRGHIDAMPSGETTLRDMFPSGDDDPDEPISFEKYWTEAQAKG